MKLVRSALALSLSAALVLLSPGSRAWAQAAEASAGSAASAESFGAAGAVRALPSAIALPAVAPALSAGLSAPAAALAAPAAFAGAAALAPASAAAVDPVTAAAPAAYAAESAAAAPEATPVAATFARGSAAAAPLAEASRALSTARGVGARAGALDRLFLGARRALGLGEAPAVDAVSPRAPPASGLARSTSRISAARAAVPAPRPVVRAARAAFVPAAGLTAALSAAAFGVAPAAPLIALASVMISLILHEIGHAKVAAALGDPTATLQGRASFNPLKWGRHIDPILTIALPLATYLFSGFIFGGAKPVPVESAYFKHPVRDMAKVAFAGPAVNLALAGAGALAYAGAAALGLGGLALGALTTFVFVNSVLALFNLIPVRPLDGGHILAAVLPPAVSARLDSYYARLGAFGLLPIIAIALLGGGAIVAAAAALTHLLIGFSVAATGVQLASAALPAVAALGMAIGSLGGPPSGAVPAPSAPRPGTATIVVVFGAARRAEITKDVHLASLDARRPTYALDYQRAYSSLMADVAALGVSPETLATYNASPVASYRRIDAATFTLDAAKVEEFSALLRAQGDKVYANDRRRIVEPVPFHPEEADPASSRPVSMEENLRITRADSVQALARARWGAPDMSPWKRALRGARRLLTGDAPAQPKVGVVDTGADTTHPLLQRVKQVQNFTTGANVDEVGHGSWVTSMVLNYAPWLNNLTHYKTFTTEGATLDDILKALTASANDGNLVISNSWGDDAGDPQSPDSQLVQKLAQEGHIMVFAAGNAGPGANTIGSPAIVQFKDPTTGAIRVVAVAATDRSMKVADFSSVGPGSPKTAGQAGLAHRPDLASVGVNTEGAWPAALGDFDRTDPDKGTLKAISGTSMSTPTVAGAIVLLAMLFGVTEIGPKLDAVVVALTSTLRQTGLNDADHEGGGFIDVQAAYDALIRQFGDPAAAPGLRRLLGLRAAAPAYVGEYRALLQAVQDDRDSAAAYRRDLNDGSKSSGVHEELIEHFENFIEPEYAARRASLEALVRAHPGVEYEASGTLGRAWLRLTGRGPQ